MSTLTTVARNSNSPDTSVGSGAVLGEARWRVCPSLEGTPFASDDVVMTGWSTPCADQYQEFISKGAHGHHTLTWLRRRSSGTFYCGTQAICRGEASPSTMTLVGPDRDCRIIIRDACSVFRLYIPQSLLTDCRASLERRWDGGAVELTDARLLRDPVVDTLVRALASMDLMSSHYASLYVNSISMAIAARLITIDSKSSVPNWRQAKGVLSSRRLDLVKEYIASRIGDAIQLSELAAVADLSRMHFSAQFRAATGLTPHKYVQLQRISRAQDLLLGPGASIVDVAMTVGFQTQAHFTVVFKRILGDTPDKWRKNML